ncbi:unnamed protein product, partial [Mesorhabditis spiculigera]
MAAASSSGGELKLTALPREILLQIFDNLRPGHVARLRLVCRIFNDAIDDDRYWLMRIQRTLDAKLPVAETRCENFHPNKLMDGIYFETERWSNVSDEDKFITDGAISHYASVDAVQLFRNSSRRKFCLSGARDRALKLFDLAAMRESPEEKNAWLVAGKEAAHEGWIWSVDTTNCGAQVLSGSWDSTISLWDLGERAFERISTAKHVPDGAVTGVLIDDNVAICSKFHSYITVNDLRDGLKTIARCKVHTGSITAIAKKGSLIYSYGVDKKLKVTDRRNLAKPLMTLSVPASLNMSLGQGLAYISTSSGFVYAIRADDLSFSHKFKAVATGHPVRQVIKTSGSILALTQLNGLKAFTLASTPVEFYTSEKFHCEPCRFDYLDGDVVVGCGDGSVAFWQCPAAL